MNARNLRRQCYVIMPFSDTKGRHTEAYWTEFFSILHDIMTRKGYNCIRSTAGPYMILEEMVRNIQESDLLIAVLTDYNPNVWYELGIRHALRNGTILLLENGEVIPYDLRGCGVNQYTDTEQRENLSRELEKLISSYLEKMQSKMQDSPVLRFIQYAQQEDAGKQINLLEQMLKETRESLEESRKSNERIQDVIYSMLKDYTVQKKPEEHRTIYRRILWVDDFPINNSPCVDLLRSQNVTVHCALSTQEGLRRLKEEAYDLVITDMGRGEEKDAGLRLMRAMRENGYDLPVIVFSSGWALKNYGQEAERLGAYLGTSSTGQLLAAVASILDITYEPSVWM